MSKGSKASRTRQVQFRMDPVDFKRLKLAVDDDDDMHSIADLLNAAAKAYLENRKQYEIAINQILRGENNG